MIDANTKKDIDKISFEILKASKAFDIYPTPIDIIIEYAELNIDKNIDLSDTSSDFITQMSDTLKTALEKIRGLLDRETKTIYLDLSQSHNRQNFVKLHECGHSVIPWQKETLKYLDNDLTLDPSVKESFEAEANYFASTMLFQQDRFLTEIKKLPLSIESPMHLAKKFGASNHATIRRYVEYSKSKCALLVLENISLKGIAPMCEVRNYFRSNSFSQEFGEISWNGKLGYTWPFVQDYYHGRRFKKTGELIYKTENGSTKFKYHFFNSTYNAFVFIFPYGESKKSKVKFVVKE